MRGQRAPNCACLLERAPRRRRPSQGAIRDAPARSRRRPSSGKRATARSNWSPPQRASLRGIDPAEPHSSRRFRLRLSDERLEDAAALLVVTGLEPRLCQTALSQASSRGERPRPARACHRLVVPREPLQDDRVEIWPPEALGSEALGSRCILSARSPTAPRRGADASQRADRFWSVGRAIASLYACETPSRAKRGTDRSGRVGDGR